MVIMLATASGLFDCDACSKLEFDPLLLEISSYFASCFLNSGTKDGAYFSTNAVFCLIQASMLNIHGCSPSLITLAPGLLSCTAAFTISSVNFFICASGKDGCDALLAMS